VNILLTSTTAFTAADISKTLTGTGHTVEVMADGLKTFERAKTGLFDLILLQENLPTLDGTKIVVALREAELQAPIIMLSDQTNPAAIVAILEAGVDDVVPMGTADSVLIAKITALLRRVQAVRSPLRLADLTLNTTTRRAMRGETPINLSTTEYNLLEMLFRSAGKVVGRQAIMDHVWPFEARESDNVLDVYVSYLRNKIDRNFSPPLIHTVRGKGYILEARK
jgi:DNA-binding response OmpR family regulator